MMALKCEIHKLAYDGLKDDYNDGEQGRFSKLPVCYNEKQLCSAKYTVYFIIIISRVLSFINIHCN